MPRNLAWLRSLKIEGVPDFGARMYELVKDLHSDTKTLEEQTNSNLSGTPAPPPPLQAVTATPTSTGVHVSIQHSADFYRGIHYHGDYSDNAHFTNPIPFYMGPNREYDLPTGPRAIYIRTFASYANSAATTPVYHGGSTPIAVTGGASSSLPSSQGSGTGSPGEGLSGFGPIPYRSKSGAPPKRVS